jgi:hypothetical protein
MYSLQNLGNSGGIRIGSGASQIRISHSRGMQTRIGSFPECRQEWQNGIDSWIHPKWNPILILG